MSSYLRLFWFSLPALGLVLALGGSVIQDHYLYFPQNSAMADGVSANLKPWPDEAGFRGWLSEPEVPVRGTVVLFHGNAGHAAQRKIYGQILGRLGLRVVLAEYPGYGPRGGGVGEGALVADAVETLALARKHYDGPLLLLGESLGARVAAAVVKGQPGLVDGLLLITPWDKLETVAAYHYPGLPVRWLLNDRYDSVANLAGFERPVAVLIAGQDAIVPPDFGKALFDSLSGPKRLKWVEGYGHNDWLRGVEESWLQEVTGFLLGGG